MLRQSPEGKDTVKDRGEEMYITITVYILVLALFVWGGRFAGFKAGFHDDFMSLESTRSIRGLAAVCIIFHHISQETAFKNAGVIQAFLNMGPALVAVFFFCSGFGLIKNLRNRPDYFNGFLKKRVLKGILIPFYVNVVLYGVFYIFYGNDFAPMQWVTNLLGLTLMNKYAWFPIVITLLYLAFYFIFGHIRNRKLCYFLMLLVIIGQGVFFSFWGHFAWWAGRDNWWLSPGAFNRAEWWMKEFTTWFFGQWWVNSTIAFFAGMLYAEHEEAVTAWFKKKYWLKLILSVVIFIAFQLLTLFVQFRFGYYTEYSGKGPGFTDKLITYFSQLPQILSFVIVIFAVKMKYRTDNPVLKFFGKYSLDTYLMNLMPLTAFEFLIQKGTARIVPIRKPYNYNLAVYIVLVTVATVVLALIENRIVRIIRRDK